MPDSSHEYVLLSIGSNIGDRKKNITDAIELLGDSGLLSGIQVSSFYETEPVGYKEQELFLNVAVSGMTSESVFALLQFCKSIEYFLGRQIRERWHSREIDIDILLYGDKTFNKSKIIIPHPRMHERRFVLVPAAEIAGLEIHPEFNLPINQLLLDCKDSSNVSFYSENLN